VENENVIYLFSESIFFSSNTLAYALSMANSTFKVV
jgi:hypothetical protein